MTISKAHALIVLAAAAALPLAACVDPTSTSSSTSGSESTSAAATTASYDMSKIPTVDEIAALVPDEVKERGTLRNGASADYAPAEFLGDDSQTPQGYDVDINKALAKVMGLNEGTTNHAEFPTIIPALGTKFDVGYLLLHDHLRTRGAGKPHSYVEVAPPTASLLATRRISIRPTRVARRSAFRPALRRRTTPPSCRSSAWPTARTRSRSCRMTCRPTSRRRSSAAVRRHPC